MNEPNLDDPNAKKKYPKNTVQLYEGLHRLKSLERLQLLAGVRAARIGTNRAISRAAALVKRVPDLRPCIRSRYSYM